MFFFCMQFNSNNVIRLIAYYNHVARGSHFVFSFTDYLFQFGVDKGKSSECRLIHGVNEVLVGVGETRLFTQELSVKIAAVSRGFLWVSGQGFQSDKWNQAF